MHEWMRRSPTRPNAWSDGLIHPWRQERNGTEGVVGQTTLPESRRVERSQHHPSVPSGSQPRRRRRTRCRQAGASIQPPAHATACLGAAKRSSARRPAPALVPTCHFPGRHLRGRGVDSHRDPPAPRQRVRTGAVTRSPVASPARPAQLSATACGSGVTLLPIAVAVKRSRQ